MCSAWLPEGGSDPSNATCRRPEVSGAARFVSGPWAPRQDLLRSGRSGSASCHSQLASPPASAARCSWYTACL